MMVNNSSNYTTEFPFSGILRYRCAGNIFLFSIGFFGIWSNLFLFRIYCKLYGRFRYKFYLLFSSLAVADFLLCTGDCVLGLCGLAKLLFPKSQYSPFQCIAELFLECAGLFATVTTEFVISIDRLIYVVNPWFYEYRLKLWCTYGLLAIPWIRVCVEVRTMAHLYIPFPQCTAWCYVDPARSYNV